MRTQFTFYESFAASIKRIRKKSDRCDAYDAIVNYALYGEEPDLDKLPDAAAIVFLSAKPNLDASKRKAESGKSGGSGKQTVSKPEANGKQTVSKPEANSKQTGSEKEKEIEIEKEKEIENECYIFSSSRARDYFLDRINPQPSSVVVGEINSFIEALTDDVVLHAFQIATDEKKTSWSYIRAILNRYQRDDLNTLQKVLDSEEKRERQKNGTVQPISDKEQFNRNDKAIQQMLAIQKKMAASG